MRFRLLLVFLVAFAMATPVFAASPELARDQGDAAVREVIRLVEAYYVFPQKRAMIAAALRKAHNAGRYNVATPQDLAERVTADLLAASNDGHLSLAYDKEKFEEIRRARPDQEVSSFTEDLGRRRNDGYEALRVLAGNVRYVSVTNFMWFRDTERIADAAARFLADADAIIIDLRGNGGGDAAGVQRLVSYFFPSGGSELIRFHDGLSGRTNVNRILTKLPGPRLAGKPLYVLIDGGTGSAAEEFAYHVEQFRLGTLIGKTTAGAANNNQLYAVPPYFVASVSVGRPEHPVSRTNWEGKGIAPQIVTPAPAALDQAHLLALQTLAQRSDPASRRDYDWDIAGLEARLNPISIPPAALDAYVGTYGIRRIWREGATLMFQRQQRDPVTLIPMGDDLFAMSNTPDVRVQFRRVAGRVVGFDQITRGGVASSSERSA